MTVKELCHRTGLKLLAGSGGLDNQVEGAYVSDLLSWVMSHARKGNVWITVQSHTNVVAVACLVDLSCIIIAEGVEVDGDTLEKAEEKGIPILASEKDAYSICCMLNGLNIR